MEFIHLATGHAFEGFGFLALAVSLVFFGIERRHSVHAQRISNLIAFTRNHREIWAPILDDPDLSRILDPKADLLKRPLTVKEAYHVRFLILQLYASYQASKSGMFIPAKTLPEDIAEFLSLPVPAEAWKSLRKYQDADFVAFVEKALSE